MSWSKAFCIFYPVFRLDITRIFTYFFSTFLLTRQILNIYSSKVTIFMPPYLFFNSPIFYSSCTLRPFKNFVCISANLRLLSDLFHLSQHSIPPFRLNFFHLNLMLTEHPLSTVSCLFLAELPDFVCPHICNYFQEQSRPFFGLVCINSSVTATYGRFLQ